MSRPLEKKRILDSNFLCDYILEYIYIRIYLNGNVTRNVKNFVSGGKKKKNIRLRNSNIKISDMEQITRILVHVTLAQRITHSVRRFNRVSITPKLNLISVRRIMQSKGEQANSIYVFSYMSPHVHFNEHEKPINIPSYLFRRNK